MIKKYQSIKIKDLISDKYIKDKIYKIINSNKQYLLLYKYYQISNKKRLSYFDFIELLKDDNYYLSNKAFKKIRKEKIINTYANIFMKEANYNKKAYDFAVSIVIGKIKDKLLKEHVFNSCVLSMSYANIRRYCTYKEFISIFC